MMFHLYKQWNLNSKARKIFTFAALHLVLKDNFTVIAQPGLTGNCFRWDPCCKETTKSLQVVVFANSVHFWDTLCLLANITLLDQQPLVTTSGKHLAVSLTTLNTITVSVLKSLATTTHNDTVMTTPRKSENPNNCAGTLFYCILLDLQISIQQMKRNNIKNMFYWVYMTKYLESTIHSGIQLRYTSASERCVIVCHC